MKKIFLIFLFSIVSFNFSFSQVKVNFFLSNFRDSVGYLMSDLMFTVLPGQVYKVGASNIRITDSIVGTGSLTPKADNPVLNANPNICYNITTTSSGNTINCNILCFQTSGWFLFGPGTYRIATLRWTKLSPLSSIVLKFRLPPLLNPTVVYDSTVLMIYNTNYTVGNPVILSASNLQSEIPKDFNLYQNYPNPFNPITTIKFDLPKSTFVTMKIYDVEGKEMEVIIDQKMEAGKYELSWDASKFASGIYFYKLTAGDFESVKKMVLLK